MAKNTSINPIGRNTDYRSYPGGLSDDKLVYEFPPLYNIVSSGKKRVFRQYIRIIAYDDIPDEPYKVNWSLDCSTHKLIEDQYFDSSSFTPYRYAVQIYNEQGYKGCKTTRHCPITYHQWSNSGLTSEMRKKRQIKYCGSKSNKARNLFIEALSYAHTLFMHKVNGGYVMSTNVQQIKESIELKLYYGMAAQRYDKALQYRTAHTMHNCKIIYPLYSQPKINGMRCFMMYDKINDKIIKYSRQHKIYQGLDHLFDSDLLQLFRDNEGLYLDGELYCPGKSIQDLMGNIKTEKQKRFDMYYYIFDTFTVNKANTTGKYEYRYNWLKLTVGRIAETSQYIRLVPATIVENEQQLDELYNEYLRTGYEGQIIRINYQEYLYSLNKEQRSYSLLKRKPRQDDEFELRSVTSCPNERMKGAFVGRFITHDGTSYFNAMPKDMSIDEMRQLYDTVCKNMINYIGKKATIEYESLSNNGVPIRPKFVGFRDII